MKKFYSLFLAILLGGTTVIAAENVVDTIKLNDGDKTPCHAESIVTRRAGDNDADWTQWLDMGSVNVTYCGAIYTNVNPELPILMRASVSEPGHMQYRIDGYLLTNVSTEEARPLIIDIIDDRLYVYPQQLPKLKVNNEDGTPFEGTLYVTDYSS